jgi:alpha-ketoglutarate-dependent 2,4-dichlorophenoxyacetate dioxygenase
MAAVVEKLHPLFGASVTGLDARITSDGLRREIEARMDEHAVIVLRNQKLDDGSQVAFTRLFGEPELAPATRGEKERSEHPEIFNVTNLASDGGFQKEDDPSRQYRLGNYLWHTDSSFRQNAGKYSFLMAHVVPPSGADTEFTDTRAVYDALPGATKEKLEGQTCEHSIWHSRALNGGYTPTEEERRIRPPAQHPLVRTIPGSNRKALYIAAHISHIIGWPEGESRALLDELMDFATQPQFVYEHKWRPGDMVIWDNRCTMHRATDFEDNVHVRDLRRTTVREGLAALA